MFIFSIEETEVRTFMDKLFRCDTFDKLEVKSLVLETNVKFDILGNINKDYLEEGEERCYVRWSELKHNIFDLIKGGKKPKQLKIVFIPDRNTISAIHKNAASLSLNLSYENDVIIGTTGTSQKKFSLDKSLDNTWENTIKKFFKKNNIAIKEG
ncbi:MAG: hypothetical protein IJ583_03210 [Firmicutes bacterium]|nr:hypothetical protein [Bacillota bacterium]